ncbi:SAM-dependent methyltransferase [Streptomyces johnsoniae]|uniref:SAM-dependent methyltransferase n=1 Tax=Streptomyces johnsoniae TaxID=3075532 RepID=A0ABU2S8C1_9ACTN|nr:SAM-dependent methyltransferase [Streptomyces sp. DSM 41886]MDT0445221.1 SAM-dependent methyltransferase [Streptomyces sp. DSM 41886]
MTTQGASHAPHPTIEPTAEIDTTLRSQARTWNHWLGGMHSFAVDREAGNKFAVTYPGLVERVRTTRHFLGRTVRYLARDAGIRQFLDVGSGLPSAGNTHEIAQRAAPGSRVVYADNDPQTVLYARQLLGSTPAEAVSYHEASLHEPEAVLAAAKETLDLSRPVALVLSGILGHVPDYEEARAIARELLAALPSGSYLMSHDICDTEADWRDIQSRHNATAAPLAYHLRSPAQIAGFFEGLELVEPGVVALTSWRPDPGGRYSPEWAALVADLVGGVGRKS